MTSTVNVSPARGYPSWERANIDPWSSDDGDGRSSLLNCRSDRHRCWVPRDPRSCLAGRDSRRLGCCGTLLSGLDLGNGWSTGSGGNQTPRKRGRPQPACRRGDRPFCRSGAPCRSRPCSHQSRSVPRWIEGIPDHRRHRERGPLMGDRPYGLHTALHQVALSASRRRSRLQREGILRRTSTSLISPSPSA